MTEAEIQLRAPSERLGARCVTHVSGSDTRLLAEEEGFEPPRPLRV